MAGRRVYGGGSNMVMILQNEGISPEAIEALLASGASAGFHASRSMVNFEDVGGSAPECSLYRQVDLDDVGIDDSDGFHQPEKKRRLTADQVQFLEKSFETENKLEPERKVQLAKDLGLQPRQVAIWFQNRRARWKTKQLEKDYDALKCSYNNLKADYENLLEEKEKLKAEVVVLTEKLLVKERGRNNAETIELQYPPLLPHQVQNGDTGRALEAKRPDAPTAVLPSNKQEEISSANSAVLDSDSPRCSSDGGRSPRLEPADSPNAFEQDYSDLSHGEDEEGMYRFPKPEDGSCHYGFQAEEQPFWFWPASY